MKRRADLHRRGSFFVKLVLIVGGSALAGAAQFMTAPAGPLPAWNIAGIFAVIAAGIGGLYMAFIDQDASAELEAAREAVEKAREFREAASDAVLAFEANSNALTRVSHLYTAMLEMRSAVEQSFSVAPDDKSAVDILLRASERSLKVAADFQMAEHWTLAIFRTETTAEGRRQLKCIATVRSLACDLSDARVWPEGVGAGGIALARGTEVIVPDLTDPALGTIHELTPDHKREHDAVRYRSIAAVPVCEAIGPEKQVWGVVVATSDRACHFVPHDREGAQTTEAVRALASMVELTIAVRRGVTAGKTHAPSNDAARILPIETSKASDQGAA